ncbi:uncharacterized protein N7496_004099 [Penicillium cataractarum]|uniref:Uncharacterized protein n=1 Tax=Penicillium cataractarum TaxID=2100454 RepID=A0A9W9VJG5_9EURO|nr:uncharacterized protein N7496_004099 [Penicillium cataractarum]KAJ5381671.1 hypothetical protein N7496_004099 [Penicillium cataractarum]
MVIEQLTKVAPYLIPVLVTKASGTLIDPPTEHICKGREIMVTENPAIHLVWYYNSLYLKHIPHFLLNYKF